MNNPLAPFIRWLNNKRAARAMRQAEHRRAAIIAQQSRRKAEHKAFKYLDRDIFNETCRSLAASANREWRAGS